MKAPHIHIIGGTEKVSFPTLGVDEATAKIDTGADTSCVWGSATKLDNGKLECVFFGPQSPYYTGNKFIFEKGEYRLSRVHNSFGHNEKRYKIKIPVIICGRRILASFTLSDRSQKTYPILIGRKLLAKKFLVDVAVSRAKITKKLSNVKKAVNS